MATKEEFAAKLAGQMAEVFSDEVSGSLGPDLDCDITQIEELAVLSARAAFDAVIAPGTGRVATQGEESLDDSRPEVPRLFLNRPKVQKLVAPLHRQRKAAREKTPGSSRAHVCRPAGRCRCKQSNPDRRISPSRPGSRFPQGFMGDGQSCNWTVWERDFQ